MTDMSGMKFKRAERAEINTELGGDEMKDADDPLSRSGCPTYIEWQGGCRYV